MTCIMLGFIIFDLVMADIKKSAFPQKEGSLV